MGLLQELSAFLSSVKLIDIAPSKDVAVLEHNMSVGEALKIMAKHRILSAPLVVSPGLEDMESLTPGDSGPSLLGWIDVQTIIKAFLAYLHEKAGPKPLPTNMLALMTELEREGPHFAQRTLITLVGSEDRSLVYQTDQDATLLTAIREFFLSGGEGGRAVHRLAVFGPHGDITHVVSQMDVLRFLVQHEAQLGAATGTSIKELGLLDKKQQLVFLAPHTPTILAYEQMAAAGVLGAPVVASDGALVANLSVSDVRCIQASHFGVLALPVAEFLAVSHKTSYLGYSATASLRASHEFFANRRAAVSRTGSGMPPPSPSARRGRRGDEGDGDEGGDDAGAGDGAEAEEEGVPLITCKRDSTFGEILRTMVRRHVHRVYVFEPGAKPYEVTAVITPTDVLRFLASAGGSGGGGANGVAVPGGLAAQQAGEQSGDSNKKQRTD